MDTSYSPVEYVYREVIAEEVEKQTWGKVFYYFETGTVESVEGKVISLHELPGQGLFITMEPPAQIRRHVAAVNPAVEDGVSGFLHPPQDVDAMAQSAIDLLSDPVRHARMANAACERVRVHFCAERVVPMYEALYERLLAVPAGSGRARDGA